MASVSHKLIAVVPAGRSELTREQIDVIVRDALRVPPLPPGGEGFVETARRGIRAATPLSIFSAVDDALVRRTIELQGFEALSEYDKRRIYENTRALLADLVKGLLVDYPALGTSSTILALAPDDPQLAGLRTADGSFVVRQVYAVHPYDPSFYLPMARFHRHLLEEKRAEFVRLMTSLGARSVNLVHDEQESESASADAGVTGTGFADVGAKASAKRSAASRFTLAMSIDEKPQWPPALPERLQWYHHEPLWQAMAEARLNFGASAFKVKFSYENDFGIDASVCATVEGVGLKVGGKFDAGQSIAQQYEVKFWPRS
jgi:hypothetical protein